MCLLLTLLVVAVFRTKLKVTAVEIDKTPSLIFTATTAIEVGDELYDYNDKSSTMTFLKHCPVCGDKGLQPNSLIIKRMV